MKLYLRLIGVSLSLMGLGIPSASGQATKPGPQPRVLSGTQGVKDAERKWLDALYRVDVPALERSESNDLMMITPVGVITKKQHLVALGPRVMGAAQPPAKYAVSRQTIHVYGAIALVTDIQSVERTPENPNPITSPGRYWQTEIWRNEAGTWKLVHLHMSPIAHHRM